MNGGLRMQMPKETGAFSMLGGNSSTCATPAKWGGRAHAVTTFLLFFKPGIISSWVSQGFDIHCLRFFFIMSSLKKTKSLGSSNKGRFHHNKPRICNLLNRENSERLDQTEGKSKAAHTAQVTVSLHAGPPHLFPANLEASWGAAEPAPHLVLPREIPPCPQASCCLCTPAPATPTSSEPWLPHTSTSPLPWEVSCSSCSSLRASSPFWASLLHYHFIPVHHFYTPKHCPKLRPSSYLIENYLGDSSPKQILSAQGRSTQEV